MLIRTYTLRFVTPAFLGNAEQDGQWRTPPIKALLRQWWRVAYAADQRGAINSVAVSAMRAAEGALFGVAADSKGDSHKSQLRLRLDRWDVGAESKQKWGRKEALPADKLRHPEVPQPIGPLLYLGYGPLEVAKVQRPGQSRTDFATALKKNAAIQAGESAKFSLAFPSGAEAVRLDTALCLMHRYGTLGGRSRNGWGSFSLVPADDGTPAMDGPLDERLTTPWQDALSLDWPHAIGRDAQGPLIWQTAALPDWNAVMRRLAEIKIGLRTQFKFTTGKGAAQPEARHWLSHPVTNHNVAAWKAPGKGEFRLPNSLRFKVRADRDGKLRGVIFHVPCLPPPQFRPDGAAIAKVWQQVHTYLDQPAQTLQRCAA